MRDDKLNFGIIIRVFMSLLPALLGMPTIATILCAYNIVLTFIAVGPMATTVSSLCAVAAAMFLTSAYGVQGELSGLVLGLQAVLCAVGCIAGLFKRKDFYSGLIFSAAGILVPQIVYLSSEAHKNGMRLADMLVPSEESLKLALEQMITIPADYENVFAITPESLGEFAGIIRNLTVMIVPATLIISAMIMAYLVMWAVTAHIRNPQGRKIHSFSALKLPKGCAVTAIILMGVLISAAGKLNNPVVTVALNMLLIIIAIMFFAGVSLLDFYLRKTIPIKFIRIIIHALIIFNFSPVYILAAFIDSFANFRKLAKETDKKGGGDYETKK